MVSIVPIHYTQHCSVLQFSYVWSCRRWCRDALGRRGFILRGICDKECGSVPFCTTPFIYWYVKHWSLVVTRSSEPP